MDFQKTWIHLLEYQLENVNLISHFLYHLMVSRRLFDIEIFKPGLGVSGRSGIPSFSVFPKFSTCSLINNYCYLSGQP